MAHESRAGIPHSPCHSSGDDSFWNERFPSFILLNESWWDILDLIRDMVSIQDAHCRILYVNQAVVEKFSIPREKILGEFCYRFFHHRSLEGTPCPFDSMDSPPAPFVEEYWEPSIERWLSISTDPILDEKGHLKGFVHILRDAEGMQTAWKKTEKKYEELFLNSGDGIFLHDFEGRIQDVNPRALELFGYTKDEILRLRLEDLCADKFPENTYIHVLQLEREGKSVFEIDLLRKDGSTFPAEISASVVDFGNEKLVFGIVRDITERVNADKEIRRRLNELETLYRMGEALNGLTDPHEMAKRVTEILSKQMSWHHAAIRQYFPADDSFLLLAFNSPDAANQAEEKIVAARFQEMVPSAKVGLSGHAARQRKTILANDVKAFPQYVSTFPSIRSGVYVPMLFGNRLVGVISVESVEEEAFSEDDVRLLEAVAEKLASSLETARLFSAERRRAARLSKIVKLSAELLNLQDEPSFMAHLAERSREIAKSDSCLVLLLDEASGEAEVAAQSGCLNHSVGRRISLKNSPLHKVLKTGDALLIPDIDKERMDLRKYCPLHPRTRGLYIYPLAVSERLLGFLVFTSAEVRMPSLHKKVTLQLLANQSAAALQNLRLFQAMRHSVFELEAINKISYEVRVVKTVEDLLPTLLDKLIEVFDTESGVIWLRSRDPSRPSSYIARGWLQELASVRPGVSGQGVARQIIQSGDLYFIEDFTTEPAVPESVRPFIPKGFRGLGVPIRSETEVFGAIVIAIPSSRRFGLLEIRLLSSMADIAGVTIQRIWLYEDLQKRILELTSLQIVEQAINASLDLRMTLDVLLENLLSLLPADAADVLIFDEDSRWLEMLAGKGFKTGFPDKSFFHLGERLPWRSVLSGEAVAIPNLQERKDAFSRAKWIEREGFEAYYATPLRASGQFLGVLEIFFAHSKDLQRFSVELLDAFAAEAAIAVDKARLFENLQRSNMELALAYDATVEGWGRAVELRDKETEGHTLRVTEIAENLARHMGIDDDELIHIRRGALLHDIGKLGIPDAILRKNGPLTEEEWAIMRKHPQIAYDLLSKITYLKSALDIPYCHHEKWDGTGYPRGLKGEEIPLYARIFAVADVYDALVSDRPYRKAWEKEKVLDYIREQSGKHFDPKVVDAFLEMMGEKSLKD